MMIHERRKNIKEVRYISKLSYGRLRGCLSMCPKHKVPDPHLDGIKCTCVFMRPHTDMCHYVCRPAACVHVSGDPGTCWWRNQVRECSRGHKLPFFPRSPSRRSVILASSHRSVATVWLEIRFSLRLCVSLARSLTLAQPQNQPVRILFLGCSFSHGSPHGVACLSVHLKCWADFAPVLLRTGIV